MPLVEDGITGYLTARNYPAVYGVDAKIWVWRLLQHLTKV
jgi:hypothetical protein